MDQVILLELVVVLPHQNLPQAVAQVHSHVYLLVVLPDGAFVAVDHIGIPEHIEEGHVEHVAVHGGVLHARAGSRLQTVQWLEAADDLLIIKEIPKVVVCLNSDERLVEAESRQLEVCVLDAPVKEERCKFR